MSRLANYKKFFINVLIGSLIAAAAVAVLAVLVGQLSDIIGRSLLTLAVVAGHAIACLLYIEATESKNESEFFSNTVFVILVLSFFTALFGTWEVISGDLTGKLYLTYFVLLFAALHGEMLYRTTKMETYIDRIVMANYLVMVLVIGLILPIIFWGQDVFVGGYYRTLSAAAIVDATLTILAVIYHKLYLQKHPQAPSVLFTVYPNQIDAKGQPVSAAAVAVPKRRTNPILLLVAIYIIGQLLVSIFFAFSGSFGN